MTLNYDDFLATFAKDHTKKNKSFLLPISKVLIYFYSFTKSWDLESLGNEITAFKYFKKLARKRVISWYFCRVLKNWDLHCYWNVKFRLNSIQDFAEDGYFKTEICCKFDGPLKTLGFMKKQAAFLTLSKVLIYFFH